MGVMGYALYQYHWRAASIRRGGRGPYDDRVGPVSHACTQRVTLGFLLTSVLVTFTLDIAVYRSPS
jgi:hypothetical protein